VSVLAALVERLREAVALPHLRAVSRAAPEDEAAFDRYAAELTAHYGVLAGAFMIVVTVARKPASTSATGSRRVRMHSRKLA